MPWPLWGFTLIFGALRVVNLAHGVTCVLGGYAGYFVTVVPACRSGWGFRGSCRRCCVRRRAGAARVPAFRSSASLQPLVSTLACAMITENLLAVAFGHEVKSFRPSGTGQYTLLGAAITTTQVQICWYAACSSRSCTCSYTRPTWVDR